MSTRSNKLVLIAAVACLLLGAIAGGLLGYSLGKQSHMTVTPEQLLYNDSSEAERLIEETLMRSKPFFEAISWMVTDYRPLPPISDERRVLLLDSLAIAQISEVSLSFGLGAFQGSTPEIRLAYIDSLEQWLEPVSRALTIIERNIDLENDDEVKAAKKALIDDCGFLTDNERVMDRKSSIEDQGN